VAAAFGNVRFRSSRGQLFRRPQCREWVASAGMDPLSVLHCDVRRARFSAKWENQNVTGWPLVGCGPLVIGHTDNAARRLCPTSFLCNVGSSYSEKPGWRFCSMAKLVFEMNQSLDGYVDHLEFRPSPALFRHFIEQVRGLTGSVYGRRMYEVMRYWDDDRPEWRAEERNFAAAWRSQPKWVVSRSLKSVGPNATLVEDDIEAVIRGLKAQLVGEIEVAGPDLAGSLTDLGLVDEYRLYLHPIVLGRGKPFFAGPRPPLRLVTSDLVGEGVIRLTYVPA
jgi:dihydrofolate reductase